jgi:uncharacterized protein
MRLAVIGASGRIGGCILREALMREHAVTALVRDESAFKSSQVDDRSLTVTQADVFQPATISAAVGDSQVMISAVGHAATLEDQGYYVRAAQSLVTAVRALSAGGPRLLVVGGFGSLESAPGSQLADHGGFPDHAAPEILGQRDALTYYRTVTDVRWTYISPPPGGIHLGGERTGLYRSARDRVVAGEPRRISTEDFAIAVLDEAERAENLFACISVAH